MLFGCMKIFTNQMDSPWSSWCWDHPIYKGRAISHYHHSSAPVPVVDIYSSSSPFETSFIGHRCQNRCKAETEYLVFEWRENWRSPLSWLVGDLLPTLGAGVMLGVGRNFFAKFLSSWDCDCFKHLSIYNLWLQHNAPRNIFFISFNIHQPLHTSLVCIEFGHIILLCMHLVFYSIIAMAYHI